MSWSTTIRTICDYTSPAGLTGNIRSIHRNTGDDTVTMRARLQFEWVATLYRDWFDAGQWGAPQKDSTGNNTAHCGVVDGRWWRQMYKIRAGWCNAAHRLYWRSCDRLEARVIAYSVQASYTRTSVRPWVAKVPTPVGDLPSGLWQSALGTVRSEWTYDSNDNPSAPFEGTLGQYWLIPLTTRGSDPFGEHVVLDDDDDTYVVLDCDWRWARTGNLSTIELNPQTQPDPAKHLDGEDYVYQIDDSFVPALICSRGGL